jgi:hypothetical protein
MIEKIWTLKTADEKFSLYIRKRDGRCLHPRCPRRFDTDVKDLQCSHFWDRAIWPLRFEPDNCDAAHPGCHIFKWETEKQGGYRDFKMAQLGQKRYAELEKIAKDYLNGSGIGARRKAILGCMEFFKKQK